VPRIGTLPLTVLAACGSSFCVQPGTLRLTDLHIGTTGSTVPTSSLDRARATSMPDAIWAVDRSLPDSSRVRQLAPVSTSFQTLDTSSVVHFRSPSRSHLTPLGRLFRGRSPRPALYRRSSRWFEAIPCRTASGGLPPSAGQHRTQRFLSTSEPPPSFSAHLGCLLGCRQQRARDSSAYSVVCQRWKPRGRHLLQLPHPEGESSPRWASGSEYAWRLM